MDELIIEEIAADEADLARLHHGHNSLLAHGPGGKTERIVRVQREIRAIEVDRIAGEPRICVTDGRHECHVFVHLLTEDEAVKLASDLINLVADERCPSGHRKTTANTHVDPATGRENCRLCIRGVPVGSERW